MAIHRTRLNRSKLARTAILAAAVCLAGLAAGLGTVSAAAETPATGAVSLADLIAQRLDLAREVAWSKFHTGAPVYDPGREAAMTRALVHEAESAGIPPAAAAAFFAAQIAASRQVQTELIAGWKAGAPRPRTAPLNLPKEIRPRLDAIDAEMLAALARQPNGLSDPAFARSVTALLHSRGFSAAATALASADLRSPSSSD